MTNEQMVEGLSLIIERLSNDRQPPTGWTPQQWAYVTGLASAQVLLFRDRIAEAGHER